MQKINLHNFLDGWWVNNQICWFESANLTEKSTQKFFQPYGPAAAAQNGHSQYWGWFQQIKRFQTRNLEGQKIALKDQKFQNNIRYCFGVQGVGKYDRKATKNYSKGIIDVSWHTNFISATTTSSLLHKSDISTVTIGRCH